MPFKNMEAGMRQAPTWMVLTSLSSLLVASPLRAQEAKTPSWWGEIETGLIFDDNILQDKTRKTSDRIWESILYMASQEEEVKWSGMAIFDRYLKNSELSYSYYQVRAERLFEDRTYGSLSLHISPSAPLDKQDPQAEPFSLGSYGLSLLADRDIDNLGNVGLEVAYTRLEYNATFNAKDSNVFTFRPSYFYRVDEALSLVGEYSYEQGEARGGAEDDISYTAQSIALEAERVIGKKIDTRLRYLIRKKRFTAGRRDPIHAGRKDTNHFLLAQVFYSLRDNIRLLGQVNRLWTRSSDALVEYTENRLLLSAAYSF